MVTTAGLGAAPRVVTTCRDAVATIGAGSTIVTASGAAEPSGLLRSLYARAPELRDVTLVGGVLLSGYDFLSGDTPFRLRTWFPPGTLTGSNPPQVDYLPLTWRQVNGYIRALHANYAFVQLGPADSDGNHSPGVSASHVRAAVQSCAVVIAEINDALPQINSTVKIHQSELDIIVHVRREPPPFPARQPRIDDDAVARHVTPLIPNNAVLQLGVGSIQSAVARELAKRDSRDLLLVGQLGDWAPDLFGIDSDGQPAHPRAYVSEIGGTAGLYCWADHNPQVIMTDAEATHGLPLVVPERPRISVNSVLEVDLFGQVNSEFIARRPVGPVGGLLDFAIAASMRDGDKAVFTLRSTTNSGRSRIVTRLEGPVAVPRSLVQIIATEHGSATLHGLSTRDRAHAIVALADPRHRASLLDAIDSLEQPG